MYMYPTQVLYMLYERVQHMDVIVHKYVAHE